MKTLLDEMKGQSYCYKYISAMGETCYRTYGGLSWYLLKCEQYGLQEHIEHLKNFIME